MMLTPDVVDGVGTYGPIDLRNGRGSALVSRFQSSTFKERPLLPARRYHLVSAENGDTIGMIEVTAQSVYAFEPVEIGSGLGAELSSFGEAIRYLAKADAIGGEL